MVPAVRLFAGVIANSASRCFEDDMLLTALFTGLMLISGSKPSSCYVAEPPSESLENSIQKEWLAPNRKWLLSMKGCWPPQKGACSAPEDPLRLILVNRKTHHARVVLPINSPPAISWAPDSNRFFVVHHTSSDRDNSYVYNPETLERQDMGKFIQTHDKEVRHFVEIGSHIYFVAKRWSGSNALEVEVTGHTDSPVTEFNLRFLVTLNASVTRLN